MNNCDSDLAKVSVILPVYKEPKEWLEESIKSIVLQSYENLEIVIVLDDPGNRWVYDIVNSYVDKRPIVVAENDRNVGLVESLNRGLKLCDGTYIARMDADDVATTDRIEKQVKFLRRYNYDLLGGQVELFNDQSRKIRDTVFSDKYCKRMIKHMNPIAHPTWIGKRTVFEELGGYRSIDSAEDLDFLLRAIRAGYRIGNIPQVVLQYRINSNSISSRNESKQYEISQYLVRENKNNRPVLLRDYEVYLGSREYSKKKNRTDRYLTAKKAFKNNGNCSALIQLMCMKMTYKMIWRRLCIWLLRVEERRMMKKSDKER